MVTTDRSNVDIFFQSTKSKYSRSARGTARSHQNARKSYTKWGSASSTSKLKTGESEVDYSLKFDFGLKQACLEAAA